MWVMFRPVSRGILLPDVQRSQASQSEEPSQSVRRKRGYVSGGLLQVVARGSGQWVREAREASQGSKASKTGGLLPDVRAS